MAQIQRWLAYELDRDITNREMAEALGITPSWYSRRKDSPALYTFEALERIATYFRLDPVMLHVAFGKVKPYQVLKFLESRPLAGEEDAASGNHHEQREAVRNERDRLGMDGAMERIGESVRRGKEQLASGKKPKTLDEIENGSP
jgi:transcriptional regulator with XRE-family HTH domain